MGCRPDNEKTIQVGAILSLTGKGASVGDDAKKGLELAVEHQNDNGGLLGFEVILNIEDSKSQSKDGLIAAKKLKSSNSADLLYVQLSTVALPVKPFSEENKMIMFGLSGSEQLLKDAKYTYRNWVAPWVAGKSVINQIK